MIEFISENLLFPFILAFICTLIFNILLIPLATRLGLVDIPGGRKLHQAPTPLVGGIAMFLAFGMACLCTAISLKDYRAFSAISLLLVFTGVLDDFHELSPKSRLFVQIFSGLLMVLWGKVILLSLGGLFTPHEVQIHFVLGLIISICAVVGVINAVNMLDGVDGLVGTMVFIQFLLFIYLAMTAHLLVEVLVLSILVAVILGYLWFNFPFPGRKHAVIFMGDAGSMFLGFALVWFAIYLSQEPHRAASPVTFLWIMMIPLFDIGAIIIRRLLHKRSPLKPDREHIHHLLQALGLNNLKVVLVLSSITLIAGLCGIFAHELAITSNVMFIIFLGVFCLYVILAEILWRTIKRKSIV